MSCVVCILHAAVLCACGGPAGQLDNPGMLHAQMAGAKADDNTLSELLSSPCTWVVRDAH